MISSARESEIRRMACRVICDSELYELPICPKAIAKKLDIELKPWEPVSPGLSGFLMMANNEFVIGYATTLKNLGYENFTVAHELGHYHLDGHPQELLNNPKGTHFSKSGFVSTNRFEREADIFAAELLMPGEMVQRAINGTEVGLAAVKEISDLCDTSLTAAAIKYSQISPDPVCVVMSEGHRICWASASTSLRNFGGLGWIEKNTPVPEKSCTFDFNSNLENVAEGRENSRETDWAHWFSEAPSIGAYEETKGLGAYGKTLTVISSESIPGSIQEFEDEQSLTDNYIDCWKKGLFRNRKA